MAANNEAWAAVRHRCSRQQCRRSQSRLLCACLGELKYCVGDHGSLHGAAKLLVCLPQQAQLVVAPAQTSLPPPVLQGDSSEGIARLSC